MIPFKDNNPTERFPFVTIGLIAINIVVFLWQIVPPLGQKTIMLKYGAVPADILSFEKMSDFNSAITVFTSMFLHGSLLHIAGNMLYLWIFGNNIEDKIGHVKFLFFYLICGIAAAYAQAVMSSNSIIPMAGASGAVAGVLGAYVLLFPRAKVHTLIFFGFYIDVVKLPALIVIGFWAIIQFINGIVSQSFAVSGGVAWFAHLGGFLAGLIVIKSLLPKRRITGGSCLS